MKYIIFVILLTGCAFGTKKETKPLTRHERTLKCVDRYIDRDVDPKIVFEQCRDLYKRK